MLARLLRPVISFPPPGDATNSTNLSANLPLTAAPATGCRL